MSTTQIHRRPFPSIRPKSSDPSCPIPKGGPGFPRPIPGFPRPEPWPGHPKGGPRPIPGAPRPIPGFPRPEPWPGLPGAHPGRRLDLTDRLVQAGASVAGRAQEGLNQVLQSLKAD